MSTSRRDFLKTTAIAGAGVALSGLPAIAEPATGSTPASPSTAAHAAAGPGAPAYTRGIGLYPGAPLENFSPELVADTTTYRNLALLRPAYHSSSYDYNLTAQLVTDGIKDTALPNWIVISEKTRGPLPLTVRETIVDHAPMNSMEMRGAHAFVDIELAGGDSVPETDRIQLFVLAPPQTSPSSLKFSIAISDDGRTWQEIGSVAAPGAASTAGYPPDFAQPGQFFTPSIPLSAVTSSRLYRIQCIVNDPSLSEYSAEQLLWHLGQVAFLRNNKRVEIGGPYSFTSAWMGAGLDEEWVYVDLGTRCEFDRIALHWIARAAEGSIQISDDAKNWRTVASLAGRSGQVDDIRLAHSEHGRYVRALMTRPATQHGFILSELEVYGRGGFAVRPHAAALADAGGHLPLAGGAWRLQRASLVDAQGEALSKPAFQDQSWLVATVPGTVLASYLNNGAIPDPNFGQNQLQISDSYFYSDFWYRTEFTAPAVDTKQVAWLNFDGINWKAEVFLNGAQLGRIEGGFMRGRFDVTGKLLPGKLNSLAVRVEKNATPGSCKQKTFESSGKNGGGLGADNPTYHASIGWDWIPTIRGRNTGIWGDVSVSVSGAVTLENPFVSTKLPLADTSAADITVEAELMNHQPRAFSGVLRGRIGKIQFERRVQLAAMERRKITFDPSTDSALHVKDPKLWWPVGYGEPNLHEVELSVNEGSKVLDTTKFQAGLRQMTYNEDGGSLKIWINGRRFIARGGNWGFGESMLRYRAREFDTAVRYHREMNFTMVRNWVGQIGDEAFYEACDRQGVMVWQDFWLANPWDGPEPNDDQLFLGNAKDFVLRIRNHASVGLYCGRNEGFPPPVLETGLRRILGDLHPGLHYIPSSADKVVSGHGPYQAMPASFYFNAVDNQLHSEIGSPNIPPIESVRLMMPESALWPQGLDWGLHDFCLEGAQGGAGFRATINNSYGGANSAEEWIRLAQFVNYDVYRAMFEAQSHYRMGILLWMSHPCWPSFVWQTYDYFFEPTAAYFGCKKGSEPLHIQWNRAKETIEVVNYSAGNTTGLTARVEVLNMDGSLKWQKSSAIDSREDSTVSCFPMQYPASLSSVHFLRLTLTRGSEVLSSNFYLRGQQPEDYRAIRELPDVKIQAQTVAEQHGDQWLLTTQLSNKAATPALMVRLKAVRERSGDRILPAIYSDNYIALMPGESRTITTEVNVTDTRGEKPAIVVSR